MTSAYSLPLGLGTIRIKGIAFHRNGCSGESFHVVRFLHGRRRMVANVFDGDGRVAVLDIDRLALGCIGGASASDDDHNAHRGDVYEPALRQAIADEWAAYERTKETA